MMRAQHSLGREVAPGLSPEARIIREQRERIEELEEEIRQLRAQDAFDVTAVRHSKVKRWLRIPPRQVKFLLLLLDRPILRLEWLIEAMQIESDDPVNIISTHLSHLRKALRPHGVNILNARGQGWMLTQEGKAKINRLLTESF